MLLPVHAMNNRCVFRGSREPRICAFIYFRPWLTLQYFAFVFSLFLFFDSTHVYTWRPGVLFCVWIPQTLIQYIEYIYAMYIILSFSVLATQISHPILITIDLWASSILIGQQLCQQITVFVVSIVTARSEPLVACVFHIKHVCWCWYGGDFDENTFLSHKINLIITIPKWHDYMNMNELAN